MQGTNVSLPMTGANPKIANWTEAERQINAGLDSKANDSQLDPLIEALVAAGTIYADVATGRDATTDGDVFLVFSAEGALVYRNDAGEAVLLGALAHSAVVRAEAAEFAMRRVLATWAAMADAPGSQEGAVETWHYGARAARTALLNPSGYKDIPVWAGMPAWRDALEIGRQYTSVSTFMAAEIGERINAVFVAGALLYRSVGGSVVQDDGTEWAIRGPAHMETRAQAVAFASAIAANGGNAAVGDNLCWADAICEFDGVSTTFSDMPGWKPVTSFVRPIWWGGSFDGVGDDTAAIAACFSFATAENIPVTFAGLTHMSVEADAQIEFDVSVDFAGCQIKARNGIIGTPSASTTTYMFRAKDAATPVVAGTATGLTASNLAAGSKSPTADFFTGRGNCFIQGNAGTPVLIPNRDKDGSMHYKQTFCVTRGGRADHPLAVDLSGYTSIDYIYREMPERGRITVANIVVDAATFNSACIVHVDRNNVEVDGVYIIPSGSNDDTFNRVIQFEDATACALKNAPVTAQTDGGDGGGTYVFSAHRCSDILLDNVHALAGWGMMSTFDISGLRITRSTLNRADSHSGMFNVTVVDCTLQDIGLVYGWGGGFIRMTGCTLIDCPAIETRNDFGGFFFGSLYVDQWQMQSDDFAQTIVSLGGDTPIGVDGFSLPAAHGIYVGPGQRSPIGNGTNREIRPVWIAVDGSLTTGSVIAPAEINIDGIHCSGNWRMRCQFDMENMIDDPSNADGTRITISDCTPSRTVAAEEGMVYVPPNTVTGGGATGTLVMSNVRNASLNTINTAGLAHFLFNCSITFAKTANNVRLQIDGGALAEPQLHNAETESPLGGAASTNDDYLSLRNVTVEHDDWDLSEVYSAIGCEIRTGRNPTLPAGATKSTMFTGWQNAGF